MNCPCGKWLSVNCKKILYVQVSEGPWWSIASALYKHATLSVQSNNHLIYARILIRHHPHSGVHIAHNGELYMQYEYMIVV